MSVERYASDFAMNFVASRSFNLLKHVIVLILWFDATFVLIARAALQVEDYKLAIRIQDLFLHGKYKEAIPLGEKLLWSR